MENKKLKCVKGESCLHCGSNYCRFVDEVKQLKVENEKLKQQVYNKTLEFEGVYKVLRKKEKALDEIEGYCEKILSDLLHYSQGTINTAENRRLEEEIEKLKGEKK